MRYPDFNLKEDEIDTLWHVEWYISSKMFTIRNHYGIENEIEDTLDDIHIDENAQLRQLRKEIRVVCKKNK